MEDLGVSNNINFFVTSESQDEQGTIQQPYDATYLEPIGKLG